MHPVQVAMERLAEAGFITKTDTEADGSTRYGVSDEQDPVLMAILKRPAMWDESSVLSQCKPALEQLREEAIRNGAFEDKS